MGACDRRVDLGRRARCAAGPDRTEWTSRLKPQVLAALTPLIWEHVNPYRRFELDMNTRLPLD